MKRFFALALSLAMILTLSVGCGGKSTTGSSAGSSAGSTTGSSSTADDSNPLGLSEKITIRYSHVQSTTSPTHLAMEDFGKYLEEQSNGWVNLEIFPAGQLYNDSTEIDAIVGGNIDMVSTYMSKLTSVDTDTQYCLAPYLFDNVDEMEKFYTSEYAQPLYENINALGLKVVNVMFGGEQYFMSNGDSVRTIDGFQGKKVREGGGAMTQALYDSLGASVTTVSFSELYTAMQTKLVDIAVTSIDSAVSIQLQEVLKSVSAYKIQYAPYLIMFNQATWDSYPEALQQVITDGLELARQKQLEYTNEGCAAAIETVKSACDFYEASDDEIAELKGLWQPIVEQYVSSKWMDAIAAFREASK